MQYSINNLPSTAIGYPDGMLLSRGLIDNHNVVHKFGNNTAVPTVMTPIASGGVYRTPQVAGAVQLRVKAGNANDTAIGTGARSITIEGISPLGLFQTETIPTNGLSAGAATVNSYIRLFRAFVASSGTYADVTTGSHVADIVIENSAGTEDWATIPALSFSYGQSQIGFYAVPLGKEAYITQFQIDVDTNKTCDLIMFKRENILETSAPYAGLKIFAEFLGVSGSIGDTLQQPMGPFPALTDIGFLGKVSVGTAAVSIDFSIVEVDS